MKVLIVEDDHSYALELEMLIEDIGYEALPVVDNAEVALKVIEIKQPDLILMDIDIRGNRTGIDIAEEIRNKKIPVIFVTAFKDTETYEKAGATSPYGYVVKPFNQLTLQSIIEITVAKTYSGKPPGELEKGMSWKSDLITETGLFIKINRALQKVHFKNILWLQADGNYTLIITKNKKWITKISLNKMLDKIPSQIFMRVHKSYIANITEISSINTRENELCIQNQNIPVGRKYKATLLAKINSL